MSKLLPATVARRLFWAALALGFILRAGYAWHAQSHHYIPTDSDEYETIALNLLSGGGYATVAGQPTSHREPGYPLFIAAVYKVCGERSPAALLGLQVVMSTLVAWLLFLIGRRVFDEDVGAIAGAAWALYPQAIYYSGYYFRETLGALAITGLIYASMTQAGFIGGVCGMIAGLTNSGLLPAAVFSASGFRRPKSFLLYVIPVAVATGTWTARNYQVQHRLVLGSTHGGEEFYQALVVPPADLGTSRQTEIIAADPVFKEVDGKPEGERNAVLMKASLAWMAAHPGLYISRAAAGLVKFWRLWPYKRKYDHSYAALVLASLVGDGWLVPLGLIGFWLFRRRFWDVPAAWIATGSTWLLYGLIHAVIRYRVPVMPAVCLLAAAALKRLFGRIRRNA